MDLTGFFGTIVITLMLMAIIMPHVMIEEYDKARAALRRLAGLIRR